MEWVLSVSLGLVLLGNLLSVAEEWQSRGLTDTSYACLFLWLVGCAGLGAWAVLNDSWGVGAVVAAPIGVFIRWLHLKVVDSIQNGRRHKRPVR